MAIAIQPLDSRRVAPLVAAMIATIATALMTMKAFRGSG